MRLALLSLLALSGVVLAADDDERPKNLPVRAPTLPEPKRPPPPLVEPEPPKPIRFERKRNLELLYAGIGCFGASYLPSLIAGLAVREYFLAIPIAGPIVELTRFDTSHPIAVIADVGFVLDALVQAGAIAMMIAGPLTHRRVAVFARVGPSFGPGGFAVRGAF